MSTMGRIQDAVHDMMRESECGYGKTAPGLQQELGLSIEQVRAIERHVEDLVFMWHGFGESGRRAPNPKALTTHRTGSRERIATLIARGDR